MISIGRRAPWVVMAAVAMAVVTLGTGHSADTGRGVGPRLRVLVKLRPQLAREVEASVGRATRPLSADAARGAAGAFLRRHSLPGLAPLYPSLVRAKVESRLSGRQLADRSRERFAARARRFRDAFNPPDLSRTYVVEFEGASRDALAQKLQQLQLDPAVEFAEEDKVVSVNFVPDDPYFHSRGSWGRTFDDLWGLKSIGAAAAWDVTAGQGVTVAVVDTGLDYNHPDIAANVWTNAGEIAGNGLDDDGNGYVDDVRGWDFIGADYRSPTPDNDPLDDQGHGTHVAGTVAAVGNNALGVIGVAWKARVLPVKGLDRRGYGATSALANALVYAADNGADVINNSWGGSGTSQAVAEAVAYAHSLGAVIVAAAGNSNEDASDAFPANLAQSICVAATQNAWAGGEERAFFSNWGSRIDVAAPGVDILSLRAAGTQVGEPIDESYVVASGTSMASPHAAGLAALILARHPEFSNEDVRQALRTSALDMGETGTDLDFGYGRIDADAAVEVASVLEAKITGPADMARLAGATTVSGVARGAGFVRYTLEVGSGSSPSAWSLVLESGAPVAGATLGTFDPSALADGVYTLRLTAFDAANRAFVDRLRVVVDYVKITSPEPPRLPNVAAVYKPGTSVEISGTATGPSFQGFRVEWARGRTPEEGWSAAGVTLTGGGSAPIPEGVVAHWNTASITEADYYTVRLLVDNEGFTSEGRTLVYLEPDLLSANWPKWLPEAPSALSHAGVVPIAGAASDTRLAVVVPEYLGSPEGTRLLTFSPDGASQTSIDLDNAPYPQPAAADLDGNPGEETIVAEGKFLRVFRPDGTSYVLSPPREVNFGGALVQVEDLDGDSRPEILAIGQTWGEETVTEYLFAWRQDGQQLTDAFPIAMASESVDDSNWHLMFDCAPRVLVADLDGDGAKEILYAEAASPTSFTLRLVGSDGAPRPGWTAPTLPGFPQMSLADLDRDGSIEIVVADRAFSQDDDIALHVFQADGTKRPGWPKQMWAARHVVADLDRDGRDEIVVTSSGKIHAFRDDGSPLSDAWPVSVPEPADWFGESLTVVDVNGDGSPEVLVPLVDYTEAPYPLPAAVQHEAAARGTAGRRQVRRDGKRADGAQSPEAGPHAYPESWWQDGSLVAIDRSGQVVRSWRLLGARGTVPTTRHAAVTAGDFDRNGTLDLAVVHQNVGFDGWFAEGVVTVLTTGAPYVASNNDWPSLFHDTRNTASALRPDEQPPSITLTSPAAGAIVTGPVTVAADARDDAGVAGVRFLLDGVELGPEDTEHPFAVVWDARSSSEGSHTLTAVARDRAGRTAVSAPVEVTVARDTVPPTVEIISPRAGSVVGKLSVRIEAADDRAVASIELWIDDVLRATSSSSPLEFLWDSSAERDGEHRVVAKAYDEARNGHVAEVAVTVPSPVANYDATLRVLRCAAVNNRCDSSALLDGRGGLGPEANQPNTISSSCADGTAGSYHWDESNDRIRVFTLDGAPFRPGRTVKVEATVWAYYMAASDKLDLYYAADASNPSWTWIATLTPARGGTQVLSATYALPAGPVQAVRARFRYGGSQSPCGRGGYDDHDDLVFAVGAE